MNWETGALILIQIYWVVWLVGSFVLSILLGGVIFRNFEAVR